MSSSCSTCSPTLGMVHQYHLSQSLRFIVVSHSGFNLHFCIIVDVDNLLMYLLATQYILFLLFSYCVVFFFNELSEIFSSFSKFPFLLPSIPLNPSLSPIEPLSVPLSHFLSSPLSESSTISPSLPPLPPLPPLMFSLPLQNTSKPETLTSLTVPY